MKSKILVIVFLLLLLFSINAYASDITIDLNPNNVTLHFNSVSDQKREYEITLKEPVFFKSGLLTINQTSGSTKYERSVTLYDSSGNTVGGIGSSNVLNDYLIKSTNPAGGLVTKIKVSTAISSGTYTPVGTLKITAEKPPEAFKLVSTNKDYDNNKYKFVFNKDFTINVADIEFKDSKGNAVTFTHSISNKELIITPTTNLDTGNYTITVKKVTSKDNEVLTNITPLTLLIKSNFYVTNKDFSNFLSTDTKELNLAFNKNLVVNTITMGDLTVTKTVDGNKLKINLPALADETSYPLSIKVTSVDNEILNLSYSLSTKSVTGNKDLDKILYPVLQMFEVAKVNGKVLVIIAIGIGVIFITAMWLWGKAKSWLKSV